MIDPLVAVADARPDAPALVDASRTWSWGTLLADTNDLVQRLQGTRGQRIALLAHDTGRAVVAIHAVRRAGATLVPLNRRSTMAGLGPILVRTKTTQLIHDAAHAPIAAELVSRIPALVLVPLGTLDPSGIPGDAGSLEDEAVAAVVFTSGTTGEPRGVRLTHASLFSSAVAWNHFLDARPTDHWLATLPLSHVAGLGVVLRSACSGARLTIHDHFDPTAVRGALATDGVTHISLVPTQLSRILADGPVVAPHLRALLLGGAPIPSGLVQQAVSEGLPVVPTYGMTETASGVTALPADLAVAHPGTAGPALPGMRVQIADDVGGAVPSGTVGNIRVSGPTICAGYDGDPIATAAALRDGWLHTGDIGALDDQGLLTVLDRRDDQIISGGENISPVEVETVLARHPDIVDAAVVGRLDATWGAVPVAAVVVRQGLALDTAAIRLFTRQHLAGYKVPVAIESVTAIPRTASGKIIRADVRRLLDSAATDVFIDRPDDARIHVRRRGHGPLILLLHATLSNALELDPLATELSSGHTVLAIDRRSAGQSVMPVGDLPGPVDAQVHIDDIHAVLDTLAPGEPAFVVGHSYGGCVGLEFAARHPERVSGAFLFEPPYLPVLPDTGDASLALGTRIAGVARQDGLAAAALAFLETINGPGISRRLPPAVLAQFEREGRSAVADAALTGFEPTGLVHVQAQVHVGLGGRSRGPYAAVAAGLAARIPSLRIHHFPTLGHGGPISQPTTVAPVIRSLAGPATPHASHTTAPGGTL